MAPATATNTGMKDAKGRTIWKGPKGGIFVKKSDGTRAAPAKAGAARRGAYQLSGETNAKGRQLWSTSTGTHFVLVDGKRRTPATAGPLHPRHPLSGSGQRHKPAAATPSGSIDGKGRPIMIGPSGGRFVIGPKGTKIAPAKRTSIRRNGMRVNWSGMGLPY